MQSNTVLSTIAPIQEDAADLELRSDLAIALNDLFSELRWSQAEIGSALEIPQPRVSELVNEKIDKLSVKTLAGYMRKLGWQMKPEFRDGSMVCTMETISFE